MIITNLLADSYILNGLVFSAFVLISYLVLTDDRFTFNKKLLFFFLLIIFCLLSLIIDKTPYLIIKGLSQKIDDGTKGLWIELKIIYLFNLTI